MAWMRVIVGFVLAPIMPGLVVALLGLIRQPSDWYLFVWFMQLTAILAYPIALALGLPLYAILKWRKWNGIGVYIAAGGSLGLMVYLVFVVAEPLFSGGVDAALGVLNTGGPLAPLGILCGIFAVGCFWLIVRPDRN